MNFFNEESVAIVWISSSSLLSLTIEDDNIENSFLKSEQKNSISYPIKIESFNPHNKRQHFLIHSTLSKNIFYDSFLTIESQLYPNFFLNYQNDQIFLSNQNKTKWQFIDGQFTCDNGQKILLFNSKSTFSLQIVDTNFFRAKMTNQNYKNKAELHKESIFHLCFHDENSIPIQTPIIFYSPQYKKVVTLIDEDKIDCNIKLKKFNPHSSSQVWIYNVINQNEIINSKFPNYFLSFNRQENEKYYLNASKQTTNWDLEKFQLKTKKHDAFIEINEKSKNLEFQPKRNNNLNARNNKTEENNENNDLDKKDCIDNDDDIYIKFFNLYDTDDTNYSNTFYILLSNQRELFDYKQDLDQAYIYNLINPRNKFNSLNTANNEYENQMDDLSSSDSIQNNTQQKNYWIFIDKHQDHHDSNNQYIFTFKDKSNKPIKFLKYFFNEKKPLILQTAFYGFSIGDLKYNQVSFWKYYNHYLNNKISISSDPRILIQKVDLSENCNITFSLANKDDLIFFANFKAINPITISLYKNDTFDLLVNKEYTADIMNKFNYDYDKTYINWRNDKIYIPKKFYEVIEKENLIRNGGDLVYYLDDYESDSETNELKTENEYDDFKDENLNEIRNDQSLKMQKNDHIDDTTDKMKEINNFISDYTDKSRVPSSIKGGEFSGLLEGGEITITKENSDYCDFLGKQLGNKGLVEISNFVHSFSNQYARLSDLSEIQEYLMMINSSNYKELADKFIEYVDKYDYSTITWIILSVSICKPLENDSLAQFCQQFLEKQKSTEFQTELKKTVKRSFISFRPNVFFLKKLHDHCKSLFTLNEIKELLLLNLRNQKDNIYFINEFPELIDHDYINRIKKKEDNFNEFIKTGLNSNEFLKIIRIDDCDSFQKIYVQRKMKVDQKINNNEFERIPLLNHSPNLIQYAAFFGSIKIFKYLYLEKANLSSVDDTKRNCLTYAIAGGNTEIIHIIEQNLWKYKVKITTDVIRNAIEYCQNEILQWLLSKLKPDNFVIKRDLILQSIISKNISAFLQLIEFLYSCESICIHYSIIFDNLEFVKLLNCFYCKNKSTLICDAAISGNLNILKYLVENDQIQVDEYIRKVAIKTAIKFDNSEIFQCLADENDYSILNALYAISCNSKSVFNLFVQIFNFSNILTNDCPLLIYVINEKQQEIADILINSKYFNYTEDFNGKSLFYFAVKNEMFEIATNLYKKYEGYFDVNKNNLFVDNCKNLKIVKYLLDYPELDVNSKNSDGKTSMEILLNDEKSNETAEIILNLLRRPELKLKQFDSFGLLMYSIEQNNQLLFEIILLNFSMKKIDLSNYWEDLIQEIIDKKQNQFIIPFVKSNLFKYDKAMLIEYLINTSNIEIFQEFFDENIPENKLIEALLKSIQNESIEAFKYLMEIIPFDENKLNRYLPKNENTLLTFTLNAMNSFEFASILLSNKMIDINKPNKYNQYPFSIAIQSYNISLINLFLNHENFKFTLIDIQYLLQKRKRELFLNLIYRINKFVGNPQRIVDLILKNDDYLFYLKDILSKPSTYNDQDYDISEEEEYFDDDEIDYINKNISGFSHPALKVPSKCNEKLKIITNGKDMDYYINFVETIVVPSILTFALNNENKYLFDLAFNRITNEIFAEKMLCESIYNKQFYFYDKLKKFHPLLSANSTNESKMTPFGNVRDVRTANNLAKFLFEKRIPIETIVQEICGLNKENKTALYTSIEEENLKLFEYLLNLSNELNKHLENKENFDSLIYTKNKDGKSPFYAACLTKDWQLFLIPLLGKMINLQNSDYFGNYQPLRAAFSKKNLDLVNFLYSKGFTIDRYSLCQILSSNLWDSFGKKFVELKSNFQFDLFIPIYMIQDEKYIDQIFSENRINLDFKPEYEDEIDEYLLISSIRNRNEKLALLILNHIEKEKILFNWQDKFGNTSLHYAIENSMTKIVYLLIDIFTSTDLKIEFENKINSNLNDLIYWKNGNFGLFFIENENHETPIHYLFKSFNKDYIIYFYNRSSEFLKFNKKIEFIRDLFNAQILSTTIEKEINNYNDTRMINFNKSDFIFLSDDNDDDEIFNRFDFYKYQNSVSQKQRRGPANFFRKYKISFYENDKNSDENDNCVKKLECEGETLLTFSILNKNIDFIRFLLKNIPEIDPNKENKRGKIPLLLAKSDITIFELLIELCSQKVDSENKNMRNDLDVNKNGIVFSIFWMKNFISRKFLLKLLMKTINFDFNQKKIIENEKGEKEELFLIDFFLSISMYPNRKILKMFLESPKLNLNIRPDIIFKLIDNSSIGNVVSYSSLFERIDDDIMKNIRTDNNYKDTVSTFAAKKSINHKAFIALIFNERVDFETKNSEGKNAIQILNEEEDQNELVSLLLKKRKLNL